MMLHSVESASQYNCTVYGLNHSSRAVKATFSIMRKELQEDEIAV